MKRESKPEVGNFMRLSAQMPALAIRMPKPAPKASWEKSIQATFPTLVPPPVIMESMMMVSIYEHGSLEPLSISSIGAELFFRPSLRERSMENTEAASVELTTEPMRRLSTQPHPSAKWQKSPVSPAVRNTPKLASSPAGRATQRADSQRVPKPP